MEAITAATRGELRVELVALSASKITTI